jgi:hypothetical protein
MMRNAWLLGAVTAAALLAGCVERRYVITSDPPGALVLRYNGEPIGATPADDHFVYYGNYHFTLIRDGYETLEVDERIAPPWYEWPPLDFVSENLVPWWIYDVRHFHYTLQPVQLPRSDEVLHRAQELRLRGRELQPFTGGPSSSGKPPAPAPADEPAAAPRLTPP